MKKIYEELVNELKKKNETYDYIHITLDTKITQINITMKVLYLSIYPSNVEIADDNCEISIEDKNWEYNEDEDGYYSVSEDGTISIFTNYSANLD